MYVRISPFSSLAKEKKIFPTLSTMGKNRNIIRKVRDRMCAFDANAEWPSVLCWARANCFRYISAAPQMRRSENAKSPHSPELIFCASENKCGEFKIHFIIIKKIRFDKWVSFQIFHKN